MAKPSWIEPCVPTLVKAAPPGPSWVHEIKHDGYRAISVVDHGAVSVFTRRGHDWADRMPGIAEALLELDCRSATIDGEVVMMGADGVSDFFAIHAALARKSAPSAVLVAFDLVHLNGEDLRERPLEERRAGLAELVRGSPDWLQFSAEIDGEGPAAWRAACRMGLEGIVSKRRGSPYKSGRSILWRKTKCMHVDQFAVIGFVPRGRTSLRSLRLAHLVGGKLIPCGSAGSGLSETMARELRAALDACRHVVVEAEHRGFTPAGELRHPVIKGWEGD